MTKGVQNRVLLKVAEQLADLLSKNADKAEKKRLDSLVMAVDPASQLASPPAAAKEEEKIDANTSTTNGETPIKEGCCLFMVFEISLHGSTWYRPMLNHQRWQGWTKSVPLRNSAA